MSAEVKVGIAKNMEDVSKQLQNYDLLRELDGRFESLVSDFEIYYDRGVWGLRMDLGPNRSNQDLIKLYPGVYSDPKTGELFTPDRIEKDTGFTNRAQLYDQRDKFEDMYEVSETIVDLHVLAIEQLLIQANPENYENGIKIGPTILALRSSAGIVDDTGENGLGQQVAQRLIDRGWKLGDDNRRFVSIEASTACGGNGLVGLIINSLGDEYHNALVIEGGVEMLGTFSDRQNTALFADGVDMRMYVNGPEGHYEYLAELKYGETVTQFANEALCVNPLYKIDNDMLPGDIEQVLLTTKRVDKNGIHLIFRNNYMDPQTNEIGCRVTMNGREVSRLLSGGAKRYGNDEAFNKVVLSQSESLGDFLVNGLAALGLRVEDVAYFLNHQANGTFFARLEKWLRSSAKRQGIDIHNDHTILAPFVNGKHGNLGANSVIRADNLTRAYYPLDTVVAEAGFGAGFMKAFSVRKRTARNS